MRDLHIMVVGATGIVGNTIIEILEERAFPIKQLTPVASSNSVGKTVRYGRENVPIVEIGQVNLDDVDIAFLAAGGELSKELIPELVKHDIICIDNSSTFRYDDDVPLVIPEVNGEVLDSLGDKKVIANPNCSTCQMLVALKPLYDHFGIDRVDVATYQSISGAGRAAMSELVTQTTELLNGREAKVNVSPVQIAFNVFPQIDIPLDNGYTKEEMKMVWETQKILNDKDVAVCPTAVRVPVMFGHSEAITLTLKQAADIKKAKQLLRKAPGVKLIDDSKKFDYPTAMTHAVGTDPVYVGRVRADINDPLRLSLWVVADNIRKGGALNAVQIAEKLSGK